MYAVGDEEGGDKMSGGEESGSEKEKLVYFVLSEF